MECVNLGYGVRGLVCAAIAASVAVGCSSEPEGEIASAGVGALSPATTAGAGGASAPVGGAMGGTSIIQPTGGLAAAGMAPAAGASAAGATAAGAMAAGAMAAGGAPAAGMPAAGTSAAGAAAAGMALPVAGTASDPMAGTGSTVSPPGPDNGDPNAPVSIPEVDCGGSTGFGLGSPNLQIGGRDLIFTYPCNKGAGAPMTFFLNLHGTTPVEQHFYQHGYFSIHKYAETHNIIVATPSSVVEQWGNGDGGVDEPHLMEVIDWVYSNFDGDGKFDIRGMWVGGHSWGAMYTTTFVCKPELADKVVGTVLMSGIGRNPACASAISVISTAAEDDIGPVVAQGSNPMSHGCDAEVEGMVGNNVETHWPNCDPGFSHANYFMLGKQHASFIDDVVVERIADLINVARL